MCQEHDGLRARYLRQHAEKLHRTTRKWVPLLKGNTFTLDVFFGERGRVNENEDVTPKGELRVERPKVIDITRGGFCGE